MAVVPFLFNNSECWTEIPKKAVNILNSLQNSFFCSLFGTSKGCPIPAYYWDTGSLTAENFIIQKKLLFYFHLSNLEEDSLAKEILNIQKEKELPGLALECKQYLTDLDIESEPESMTKNQWKRTIQKKYMRKINKNYFLQLRTIKS